MGFREGDTEDLPLNADLIHDGDTQVATVSTNPLNRISPPRITISGEIKGFLTPDGFKILGHWKTKVTAVMNAAASAQRLATALKLFLGTNRDGSLRRLAKALAEGEDVKWVQLTESEGNKFRQDLPPYLFLGQEHITKEARGCRHFDLSANNTVDLNICMYTKFILPYVYTLCICVFEFTRVLRIFYIAPISYYLYYKPDSGIYL